MNNFQIDDDIVGKYIKCKSSYKILGICTRIDFDYGTLSFIPPGLKTESHAAIEMINEVYTLSSGFNEWHRGRTKIWFDEDDHLLSITYTRKERNGNYLDNTIYHEDIIWDSISKRYRCINTTKYGTPDHISDLILLVDIYDEDFSFTKIEEFLPEEYWENKTNLIKEYNVFNLPDGIEYKLCYSIYPSINNVLENRDDRSYRRTYH